MNDLIFCTVLFRAMIFHIDQLVIRNYKRQWKLESKLDFNSDEKLPMLFNCCNVVRENRATIYLASF